VTHTFSGSSTTLAFEDWTGSPYAQAYPGSGPAFRTRVECTSLHDWPALVVATFSGGNAGPRSEHIEADKPIYVSSYAWTTT
jgi:hypothetical protein